jgi:hypothetical protein
MKRIRLVLAALALALLFSTCQLPTTTIDECIDSFMSDINSNDRSEVYKNLDSSSSKYAQAITHTYWDALFPLAGITYTLSSRSTSGHTVSATINSTYATFVGGLAISFDMSEDSTGNAVINSITLSGVSIFY